jgi:hypothetical protein
MAAPQLDNSERDLIVVIKRKGARSFSDHAGVKGAAQKALAAHIAASPSSANMKLVEFDKPGTLQEDIALFKRARVVLAGHGAGTTQHALRDMHFPLLGDSVLSTFLFLLVSLSSFSLRGVQLDVVWGRGVSN